VVGNEVSGTTTIFTVDSKDGEKPDTGDNTGNGDDADNGDNTGNGNNDNGQASGSADGEGLSPLGTIFASLAGSFVAILTALVAVAPQLQPVRDRIAELLR